FFLIWLDLKCHLQVKFLPRVMENAVELSVPLKVDSAFGDTWYDAK
ncbi:hypothetical protein, partial [Listeria monocytogenes]